MSLRRKRLVIAALCGLVLAGAVLVVNADRVVELIGIENTYGVVFLIAVIGGLSTFTGVSLFAALAAFSVGGSHPLLLGLSAGIGIFISDSLFFYVATYGKKSLPLEWERRVEKITAWTKRVSERTLLIGSYVYLGFSPFPNDLLMLVLAAAGISYRTLWPVLLAGSITVATGVSYLGRLGISL
jgi:hypothetical protein